MRLLVCFTVVMLAGCDRAPSPDAAREWSARDHDKSEQAGRAPRAPASQGGDAVEQLGELTWQQNCAQCHGPIGHGDGPTGPLVKAPDLTRADWQTKTSDAEMADQIRNGKGLMPKFALPDAAVAALIVRIRASAGR